METEDEQSPDPADCAGWRRIISQNRLPSLRAEAIVAAIQTIGPDGDQHIVGLLLQHVADRITRILHFRVDRQRANRDEIIDRIQFTLLQAVLQPQSADGKNLRVAFRIRVEFRALDAIRKEDKYRKKEPSYHEHEALSEPIPISPHWTHEEQSAHVESILRSIPDPRKQLAFRFFMDGMPMKSKKGHSISQALKISDKTAEKWIAEVQAMLKLTIGEGS